MSGGDERSREFITAAGGPVFAYLSEGHTLGEALGYEQADLDSLYQRARALYENAKYDEAMRVFALLLAADHTERCYFGGFAACMQMLQRFDEALKYWGISSLLDLGDPAPVMHSAECYLALGRHAEAAKSLRFAMTQARAQAVHAPFVPRLEAMLEFMDRLASAPASQQEPNHV